MGALGHGLRLPRGRQRSVPAQCRLRLHLFHSSGGHGGVGLLGPGPWHPHPARAPVLRAGSEGGLSGEAGNGEGTASEAAQAGLCLCVLGVRSPEPGMGTPGPRAG